MVGWRHWGEGGGWVCLGGVSGGCRDIFYG